MPSRPPSLIPRKAKLSNWTKRASRQSRGYGADHDRMRARVLIEEPLCRLCMERGVVTATAIADHIVPKAEGGGNERSNYQGLCSACHVAKTAREAARARRRARF